VFLAHPSFAEEERSPDKTWSFSFEDLSIVVRAYSGTPDGPIGAGWELYVDTRAASGRSFTEHDSVIEDLMGVWLADLDRDGNPEVVIWKQDYGTSHLGSIMLLEWNGGGYVHREGGENLGSGTYAMGHGFIEHRYERFRPNDPTCCPSGGSGVDRYGLRNDKLVKIK